MGKQEKIQKELDLLLEKLRFWRYVIFGIISGMIGIFASGKTNERYIFLLFIGVVMLFIAIKRIDVLSKYYQKLLDDLEKE